MPTKMDKYKFEKVNELLPLEVGRAHYDDSVILHVGGLNWRINIATDWRLIIDKTVVGFETDNINDYLQDIIGTKLLSVRRQSTHVFDPSFEFSNGYILEVFCIDMEVENWTIWLQDRVFMESFGDL